MKFGPLPLDEAEGAILAHSVSLPHRRLRKGRRITVADVEALGSAGIAEVVVARLAPGDLDEDTAAARLAAALAPDPVLAGLSITAPFTGRVNLCAETTGVVKIDAGLVDAINAIDESITLATLPDLSRVGPRQMVATVKIIPYAAPDTAVVEAERLLSGVNPTVRVHGVVCRGASLFLTRTPGMSDGIVRKGIDAVRGRLDALGIPVIAERIVAHREEALADALQGAEGDMVLILTGSATSDRNDVGPAGLIAAGGEVLRLGMPVDPGNLLFLGCFGSRPVIGLPGCARSPKLNGADWIMERIACGLDVSAHDITGMGVGGLLKEIPSRPAPRTGGAATGRRPVISVLLLAAGQSSRMRGRDKLLEPIDGVPMLGHMARVAQASKADEVIVVLRPGDDGRRRAIKSEKSAVVQNPRAAEGMGTSIAAGIAAIRNDADGVLIMLADMPEIMPADLDRLIAALDETEGRAIVRATDPSGRPGHPVLFGRRFFELLRGLQGERGAREVLHDYPEFITEVSLTGTRATIDLDTPEDWAAWQSGRHGAG